MPWATIEEESTMQTHEKKKESPVIRRPPDHRKQKLLMAHGLEVAELQEQILSPYWAQRLAYSRTG